MYNRKFFKSLCTVGGVCMWRCECRLIGSFPEMGRNNFSDSDYNKISYLWNWSYRKAWLPCTACSKRAQLTFFITLAHKQGRDVQAKTAVRSKLNPRAFYLIKPLQIDALGFMGF